MLKSHGSVRFVGLLVVREARLPIDPENRTLRIRFEVRRDLVEMLGEIDYKLHTWLPDEGLVLVFVFKKPFPPVVALEPLQEIEQFRSEISHWLDSRVFLPFYPIHSLTSSHAK